MRGAIKQKEREEVPEELEIPVDFPLIPEPATETAPKPGTPETEPVAEPTAETEPVVVPPEPTPPVTTDRPSRITRKPIRFSDYECYPCEIEPEVTEMTAGHTQQVGKMTPQGIGTGPAASRVSLPPALGQIRSELWSGGSSGGVSQLTTPLDAPTKVEEFYQKEWPELTVRRRNTK